MKFLVVGGAGFVGSNLVRALLDKYSSSTVDVFDDLSLGVIENLPKSKRVKLIDVFDDKYACVFFLAGHSSAPMFKEDHMGCLSSDLGVFDLACCRAWLSECPLVYASTSSMVRTGSTPEPRSFYELSKFNMENFASVLYHERGLKSTGLRFFSVYGPREQHKKQYANLATQFMTAALKGDEIVVYGDGAQTRDFIHVDDVCAALIHAYERHKTGVEASSCAVYHAGTTHSFSVNLMLEYIAGLTNKCLNVNYVDNPIKNYVQHTLARKQDLLPGWRARVNFRDGLNSLKTYIEGVL